MSREKRCPHCGAAYVRVEADLRFIDGEFASRVMTFRPCGCTEPLFAAEPVEPGTAEP